MLRPFARGFSFKVRELHWHHASTRHIALRLFLLYLPWYSIRSCRLFHVLQSSSFFTSVPVLRGKVKGEGGTPKNFGLVRAAQGLKPLSYLRMRQLRSEKLNLKKEIQFKGKN